VALSEQGITARLIGGLAIASHCHRPCPPQLARTYADIDLVVRRSDARSLAAALDERGYTPNRGFNNLHGDRRLLFYDEPNARQLDVFVGSFQMCHALELDDRLDGDPRTLTPADLLLTKLQIVEANAKDLSDALLLLFMHDLGVDGAGDVIGVDRLVDVTHADWGWFTTSTDSLERVSAAASILDEGDVARVRTAIDSIRRALEEAPKTLGWRARARIGRHKRWYELPEEVG
jgi:hypothetical protein